MRQVVHRKILKHLLRVAASLCLLITVLLLTRTTAATAQDNGLDNEYDNGLGNNFNNSEEVNNGFNSSNEDFDSNGAFANNSGNRSDAENGANSSGDGTINSADFDTSAFDDSFANEDPADVAPVGSTSADPLAAVASRGPAASSGEDEFDKGLRSFNQDLRKTLQSRFLRDLRRYCLDYCSLLSFDVTSKEVFDAVNPDLGFDNGAASERSFEADRVTADVLIDVRYGQRNTERLKKLIDSVVRTYSFPVDVVWTPIELPETDDSAKSVAEVKKQFGVNIRAELERVVRDFCPAECSVTDLQVQVEQASIDDISDGSLSRYIFARGARGSVYVKGVNAAVSVNADMEEPRRLRIENLLREVLQPFGSVNLSIRQMSFPRSAEELRKDLEAERADPYGLEKLRQMLAIFKEFAGTKEIIRETSSSESSARTESSASNSSSSSSIKESDRSASLSEQKSSSDSRSETGLFGLSEEMLYVVGAILLLLVIAGAVGLRFVMNGRRMQQVVDEGLSGPRVVGVATLPAGGGYGAPNGASLTAQASGGSAQSEDLVRMLEIQKIKDELIQTFLRQPKVAREVFGRILKEDGVLHAAKCVSIFGEIVTFELLDDNELKDGLTTLAEYVHKNVPRVDPKEELEILQALKLRVAAGKIKVMTAKGTGSFDFLRAKSARQIYNLIADENPESQSIVLTQLDKSKRNAVFDLFEGESKVGLLRALCQGRTVATEYLMSLADALRRKAQRLGILDQGAMTGVDVLLDLLGQANLSEQQNLMTELDATNPEAARMVRSSLVTPETLQFIRDGLLIEVFLSLEAQTLATFLAGCADHLRSLILSKVPQDIAEDWYEMLSGIKSIDPENYRIAEMQILTKVRSFSESGMINLLEINQSLFPVVHQSGASVESGRGRRSFRISQSIVA